MNSKTYKQELEAELSAAEIAMNSNDMSSYMTHKLRADAFLEMIDGLSRH